MVHIVDGALSAPVLAGGAAIAVAGVAIGLKTMNADRLPQVGVLSAVFFVASLIHVPIGPSSVHLLLGGLVGMVLGWAAFPAMLVALLLQAVFFGFGGLTVLGVNTASLALPAVACWLALGRLLPGLSGGAAFAAGAFAGAFSVAATALLVGLFLSLSGEEFLLAARLVFIAHLPVMAVEAVVTGAAVTLLCRVKPEVLAAPAGILRNA